MTQMHIGGGAIFNGLGGGENATRCWNPHPPREGDRFDYQNAPPPSPPWRAPPHGGGGICPLLYSCAAEYYVPKVRSLIWMKNGIFSRSVKKLLITSFFGTTYLKILPGPMKIRSLKSSNDFSVIARIFYIANPWWYINQSTMYIEIAGPLLYTRQGKIGKTEIRRWWPTCMFTSYWSKEKWSEHIQILSSSGPPSLRKFEIHTARRWGSFFQVVDEKIFPFLVRDFFHSNWNYN